jgi:8-hydroxy-5-deazaflavin:NADPH oxidoreductase
VSTTRRPILGIYGAGKVGVALARLALEAGYTVHIATSGSAEATSRVTRYFAPGAVPSSGQDLPAHADILILAVPLGRFRDLPLDAMGGHIVIDVMNYWPPINGVLPEFDTSDQPSSRIVRDSLPPTAQLVKTFNHLGYHQLEELPQPVATPDRAALAIAGDDIHAVTTVARLIDDLGFDPIPAGTLADSHLLEPDSAVFGHPLDQHQMRQALEIVRAA